VDLHIDIELQGRVLLVAASGPVALDAAVRLIKQAFDAAKEKEVNKILVNTFAVNGALSTFERYTLAIEVVAYLRQREMNPRVAFVGKLPTTDGFGVRVAQNRNLTIEVFSSQEEALNWLANWPG
jgi:dihydroxyacetone kinase